MMCIKFPNYYSSNTTMSRNTYYRSNSLVTISSAFGVSNKMNLLCTTIQYARCKNKYLSINKHNTWYSAYNINASFN